MKKRLIVNLFLLVAVTSLAVAPVFATVKCYCAPKARGDWQVLSNDASGAVVRAWVINHCRFGRFVNVTVVANAAPDGNLVSGDYPLYMTTKLARPVDVEIDSEILRVNRIIVVPLGAAVGF